MEKHLFQPVWKSDKGPASIEACEELLGEHFGHECVVTGSGRSAIDLTMRMAGLNRYRNQIALTPMISKCVLEVLVNHGYPVDPAGKNRHELVLRYHQLGIPQKIGVFRVPVIEDICHAFFANSSVCVPRSGNGWAVFSLPKFFPVAGMTGGIVVRDIDEARALRELRDRSIPLTDAEQLSQQEDLQHAYTEDPRFAGRLEMLFLKRRLNSRCHPLDLAGFPSTLKGIEDIRLRRCAIIQRLLGALDPQLFPTSWHRQLNSWLPFALPVFLNSEERMNAAKKELNSNGISCNVFSIDVARNQAQPDLQQALVVPCHQQLSDITCNMIASALLR